MSTDTHPVAQELRRPQQVNEGPAVASVHGVPVPTTELLAHALPHVTWSDAYAVVLPVRAPVRDAQEWADAIFRGPPRWIRVLFGVRGVLVRVVGIEPGDRHVFDTLDRRPGEVLLGTTQRHLGFRASVLVNPTEVVVTTLVDVRSGRGHPYSALVRRVHPPVVRGLLARAASTMAAPA
jgi:hypothetical protein